MCRAGKGKEVKKTEAEKNNTSRTAHNTRRSEKRGWGHIIDKEKYSNGPGDNIYVFG